MEKGRIWRISLISVFVLMGVVVLSKPAFAETAPATKILKWVPIKGSAVDLTIGADGAVFALNGLGQVWLRRPKTAASNSEPSWTNLPGKFTRIASASMQLAWAIDANSVLYQWRGSWWKPMNGLFPIQAMDVGVSPNGMAFASTLDGRLVVLDMRKGAVDLSSLDNTPRNIINVDVDAQDRPWVTTNQGKVFYLNNGRWQSVAGLEVQNLSVTGHSKDAIWFIGLNGDVIRAAADGRNSEVVAARASVIASTPNGKPWIATADGAIYANDVVTGSGVRQNEPVKEQVFTQLINWQRVNGNALELAISAKGAIAALGQKGEVWHWKGKNNWGLLPGKLQSITLDVDATLWGLDATGRILRYQGSYWKPLRGKAKLIATGADGSIWILNESEQLQTWNAKTQAWVNTSISIQMSVKSLTIDVDGHPWIIDDKGQILHFDGDDWTTLPDIMATSMAASPEGTIFVTDDEQVLWRWDSSGNRWDRSNGDAIFVAAGPLSTPWVVRSDGTIFAGGFFDEIPGSKVKTVSVATSNANQALNADAGWKTDPNGYVGNPDNRALSSVPGEAIVLQKVSNAPRELAIGADGSIFALNFDSLVLRWNNGRNEFLEFPGRFSHIAVAPDGNPWGINADREVFRHDGNDWRVVSNILATDISISFDGTVMVVGPQNFLYRFNEEQQRFERVLPLQEGEPPPRGKRVALDQKGVPWVILDNNFVAFCEKFVCARTTTKAKDIDIGPDGTLFIIDTNNKPRRWNQSEKSFERINTLADPLAHVAVGPLGKPWFINLKDETWSSAFFPRDETQDIKTVATTTSKTTTSSTPVFTFSQTLNFESVPYAPGFQNLVGLTAAPTGKIMALHLPLPPAQQFLVYDPNSKQFTNDVMPASPGGFGGQVDRFALGPNNQLWGWINPVAGGVNGQIFLFKNNAWQEIFGVRDMSLAFPTPPPPDTRNLDLTVSANGDVLVAGPDTGASPNTNSTLYRFVAARNQFVAEVSQFAGDESAIAVEPSGSIWLVTNPTGADNRRRVYQYFNNSFVERPLPAGSTACNQAFTNIPKPAINNCIGIGANGSVFLIVAEINTGSAARKLLRWNPSSIQWDKVNTTPAFTEIRYMTVATDGRPWIVADPGDAIFRVYKAN